MAALVVVLVLGGVVWRHSLVPDEGLFALPSAKVRELLPTLHHPVVECVKLVTAFLIGSVLTAVHKVTRGDGPELTRSMEHAQILLCVSGALMMVIIGDSLARAFGIAGAASIIRFRTPVEDPKDTIILFLMLGLGMAAGLGAFALAGLGTGFLALALLYLAESSEDELSSMWLTLGAAGPVFPSDTVASVLSRHGIDFERREMIDGPEPSVRYRVRLKKDLDLDRITSDLKAGEHPVRQVSWESKRKKP